MKERLTLLIPCKDEERDIRPCIESARAIADEVLVADSGSSDRTIELAEELGARVIRREYVNPANFRNWAIPQAANRWVLLLDADERLTPELAREIESLLSAGPEKDGYRIRRRGFVFGHVVKRSGWGNDWVLRLFRRDLVHYPETRIHEQAVVSTGRVGKLRGLLDHYTYWTFDELEEKTARYTTWAAQDLMDKGRKAGFLNMAFRPAWRFFRQYILQRGFLDGRVGLIVSLMGAYYVFLKYAKLWVMQHGRQRPGAEGLSHEAAPAQSATSSPGVQRRVL